MLYHKNVEYFLDSAVCKNLNNKTCNICAWGGGGDLSCRLGKVLVLGVYTVCFKFQHSISPPGGVGLSDREGGRWGGGGVLRNYLSQIHFML